MTPIRRRLGGEELKATVTTDGLTNISQTGATLSGSYSSLTGSVVEAGFTWATSSDAYAKPGWSDFKNF